MAEEKEQCRNCKQRVKLIKQVDTIGGVFPYVTCPVCGAVDYGLSDGIDGFDPEIRPELFNEDRLSDGTIIWSLRLTKVWIIEDGMLKQKEAILASNGKYEYLNTTLQECPDVDIYKLSQVLKEHYVAKCVEFNTRPLTIMFKEEHLDYGTTPDEIRHSVISNISDYVWIDEKSGQFTIIPDPIEHILTHFRPKVQMTKED